MLKFSDQIAASVQSKPTSKCSRFLAFHELTLKDIIETLFALLIPATIGILAVVLQQNEIKIGQENRENDIRLGDLQRESDEEQTRILGNETVFSTYVKNMADLMLRDVDDGNLQYNLTRVFTLTVFRQLDLEKKRLVIQFLYDTEFLKRGVYIFNVMDEVRSDNVKNLKGANLDNVDFGGGLELPDIILRGVRLVNASFSSADLRAADFSNSILSGVSFLDAKLDNTQFINTDLQRTDFTGASVKNIRLIRSNLTESSITDEQISEALFVFNLILPNGTYAPNKTFLVNGNAQQGTYGWNITSGKIQVRDAYFFGTNGASMSQRINTTLGRIYGNFESFQYCLSLLVHRPEDLSIQLTFLNRALKRNDVLYIDSVIPDFCYDSSSSSLSLFCYWSFCKDSTSGTDYIDLTFMFQSNNTTTNGTDFPAIKNIEFTIVT